MSSSNVGALVKFRPFTPMRGAVFFNLQIRSSLLYSSITEWMASFLLIVFIILLRFITPSSLAIGIGMILLNLPSFFLNMRSIFNTFSSKGLGLLGILASLFEMMFLPSNLDLKVFVSRKGLDHLLLLLLSFLLISIYFISIFFSRDIYFLRSDSWAYLRAFRLESFSLAKEWCMLGIDRVGFRIPLSTTVEARVLITFSMWLWLIFFLSEQLISLDWYRMDFSESARLVLRQTSLRSLQCPKGNLIPLSLLDVVDLSLNIECDIDLEVLWRCLRRVAWLLD